LRSLVLVVALVALLPLVAATPLQTYTWMPAQGEPNPEFGPVIPPAALPLATVTAFSDEKWHDTGDVRFHTIDVPAGPWNRVIMTYTQNPENDPWDRLFQAFFGAPGSAVEVLRGAAPRSDMTVTRDVTRYASLLPAGGTAVVGASTSEWDQAGLYTGAQHVWVNLSFYEDPAASLSEGAATSVVPVYTNAGSCGSSAGTSPPQSWANVTFPASPNATLEFYATNHGNEEGYKLSHSFDVLVDGHLLTTVYATQYRYAWDGVYGGDTTVHPIVWWSAFQVLDVVGVHTGVGQIPPYRLALDAQQMALLPQGKHTITLQPHGLYDCVWITSLSFLMEP
jgi:hypothetical protein